MAKKAKTRHELMVERVTKDVEKRTGAAKKAETSASSTSSASSAKDGEKKDA
jgi:hypothetical protein